MEIDIVLSTVGTNWSGLLVPSGGNRSYYLLSLAICLKIHVGKVVVSVGEAVFSAWEKVVAHNCIKAYFPGVCCS